MKKNLVAAATVSINASDKQVWEGLTNPQIIKQYMMGAVVNSDWKKGSKITWKGEMKGKKYEDKGEILETQPNKKLVYTHFSDASGADDVPEHYHTITVTLSAGPRQTTVALTQDRNETEEARQESQKNWTMMLESLKKILEEAEKASD